MPRLYPRHDALTTVRVDLPEWAEPFMAPARFKCLKGGRGSAKALRDDTPIATPDGWTAMGELRVGDRVFGTHGHPVSVTGVHPQGERDEWAVDFKFGETIHCDGDHLWRMIDHLWRKRRNRRGLDYSGWSHETAPASTSELAALTRYGKRGDLNLAVPIAAPLHLPHADLPIDPYLFGLWLGDGESKMGRITAAHDDAEHYAEAVEAAGETMRVVPCRVRPGSLAFTLTPGMHKGPGNPDPRGFRRRLITLGVFDNKHIPPAYRRASYEQRMALLAGLMDTDGTIKANGTQATFTGASERLAANVYELVVSLGVRATLNEKWMTVNDEPYRYFQVRFVPFPGCASLPRKVARIPTEKRQQRTRQTTRMVRRIARTGEVSRMTCITVDAADSMFLAGRSLIPTHNSHTFAQLAVMRMAGLLPQYEPGPVRIASARQFQNSIEESVKQAVEHYIDALGLGPWFDVKKYAIDHVNGSHMFFPGFNRNPDSLRSTEGLDVLWIEEAQTLGDEMRVIAPTIRKPGSELWFSWNPIRRTDWVWQRFEVDPRDGDVIAHVNYYDNPWFHLTESVADMEWARDNDPAEYAHVWLGEPDDTDAGSKVLPYAILRKCVDAHAEHCPPWDAAPFVHAGFDIAYGGRDRCSLVIRRGPEIRERDSWPGVLGDVQPAVERAHETMGRYEHANWRRLYYDASGGDTIRGPFMRLQPSYQVRGVGFGDAVGGPDVMFERGRKNKAVFARANIQMAWALRLRANRTVRLLEGHDVDPLHCLFINPQIDKLESFLAEMGRPIHRSNPTTGKREIDKRGDEEESPDDFDGASLAFRRDSERGLLAHRGR